MLVLVTLRDWSLITGRGGATKREGGTGSFTPMKRHGAEKVLAILKGGGGRKMFCCSGVRGARKVSTL